MPWKVTVRSTINGAYVTVLDVFNALYEALRRNVHPEEFYASGDTQRVTDAYQRRYRRAASSAEREQEKAGGVKRVDLLKEKIRFAGLTSNSN